MLNVFAVFVGGGIGSVLRYLIGQTYVKYSSMTFPLATFGVNVIGSFVIGCAMAYIMSTNINVVYKYAIIVGFCGGLTTFSTFSFELFDLVKNGHVALAIIYTVLSFLACIGMTALGYYWTKCYV